MDWNLSTLSKEGKNYFKYLPPEILSLAQRFKDNCNFYVKAVPDVDESYLCHLVISPNPISLKTWPPLRVANSFLTAITFDFDYMKNHPPLEFEYEYPFTRDILYFYNKLQISMNLTVEPELRISDRSYLSYYPDTNLVQTVGSNTEIFFEPCTQFMEALLEMDQIYKRYKNGT